MHGEQAEKVQGTRCAMRGSGNLDEAIQDIAVVLHEHFRHVKNVRAWANTEAGSSGSEIHMAKSVSVLPSKPACKRRARVREVHGEQGDRGLRNIRERPCGKGNAPAKRNRNGVRMMMRQFTRRGAEG